MARTLGLRALAWFSLTGAMAAVWMTVESTLGI